METEMLRNGSGYIDPTAAKAMKNMVGIGEIWTTTSGREVLTLKNHGVCYTVLTLMAEEKAGCIAVMSRDKRFCNPAFVTFTTRNYICGFVRRLEAKEFEYILRAVAKTMEFGDTRKEINALKADNARLRVLLRDAKRETTAELPYKDMYYDLLNRLSGR